MCNRTWTRYGCHHEVAPNKIEPCAVVLQYDEPCTCVPLFTAPQKCSPTHSLRYKKHLCPECRKYEKWRQERSNKRMQRRQSSRRSATRGLDEARALQRDQSRKALGDSVHSRDGFIQAPPPVYSQQRPRGVQPPPRQYEASEYEPMTTYLNDKAGYYGSMGCDRQPYVSEAMMREESVRPVSPLTLSDEECTVVSIPSHDEYAQYQA
ncbi:hypothetical protein B0T10DRAFT_453992 [Thelonectria olida]|uniref:Uncharacterized protein n=1 Tax=Thelonectria olida TaxID=1576542 RepID=A0A9P9AWG6_9HYPO|nr:hypothetical protein B0T10DRAFT_453992 [Thelonectria olida]